MPDMVNRGVAVAAVIAIAVVVGLGVHLTEREDATQWAGIAPPAEDALTQAVDLNRIAGFKYLNDRTIEITDEAGKKFGMEFTEACPALEGANDFSLVTESFKDMDRFTGIAVKGHVCTFRQFSPR